MKRVLITINLVILIFLTIINSIFLFEIAKDKELSDFYFKNIELSEAYLDIEISHMQEVKDLVDISLFVNIVSLFLLLFNKNYKQQDFKFAGVSLLAVVILLVVASVSFESFFNQWHELVFVSDNWLLPADAKLIQDYPLSYFKDKFILFDILLAFVGVSMLVFYYKILKSHR